MKLIVMDAEAFEAFKLEIKGYLHETMTEFLAEKNGVDNSDWITLNDAKKLLPFKSKTSWQKLRDRGTIKFTQFGRKIMYSKKSILDYMSKNKVGL